MVKELVVYPDDRILSCADVRDFKDESLPRLLQDMKDTMEAHNLKALSAIQVAHPFNIAIIKLDNGEYLELINPRILSKEGMFDSIEKTSYFPDIEIKVPRFEKIKLIYEDRNGNSKHMNVEDRELSATIQRKLNFLAGGTPLDKVDKNYREQILAHLESKGLKQIDYDATCPVFSKKDYIRSFTDKVLFFMGISLLTPLFAKFFNWSNETISKIYTFDKYAYIGVIFLMILYFIYAQYEAKKYRQCSSCQIGNQIGIIVKRVGLGTIFAILAYFLIGKYLLG